MSVATRLDARIMAHPSRREWAEELSEATGAAIIWDERSSAWDTGKRALLDCDGTHALILQDDVILSDGLLECVEAMVAYSGDHPIGLYAGSGKKVRAAMAHNPGPWWAGVGPIWGPAVVIPTHHVAELVKYGDRKVNNSYDIRLWQWYQAQGISCYYTNPSLVDHRVGHGSLLSKGRDRQAERFGSGVGLDWSQEPPYLDGQALFPRVDLWKGNQRKPVRKYTSSYYAALKAGFAEADTPA